MRIAHLVTLSLTTFPLVTSLHAQTGSPLAGAAATITEADVKRRIYIIADDSMMGRDTPSRGLELTAQYVVDQFKRFGLKPGGENGTYFLRYGIVRKKVDLTGSTLTLSTDRMETRVAFTSDALLYRGSGGGGPLTGPVVLLAGPLEPDSLEPARVRDRIVLWPIDNARVPKNRNAVSRALSAAGAKAVLVVTNIDSVPYSHMVAGQAQPHLSVGGGSGGGTAFVLVHERVVKPVLAAAGLDVAQLYAAAEPSLRDLPGLRVGLDLKEIVTDSASAPISIGILEGGDPKLRNEYVVFSAHMDHIGITPGKPDSINNGADDDGSGTVGVIELAEAFSRKGVRPKRSLIFMTVSGEEKGLWGSQYFSEHPTVPLERIVADLNMDMIGRNWKDTIVAIGKEHSDLGTTLNRVNAAHPELHMTAIDDRWPQENFYFRSDHFNFARKGVPILFFFNGVHEDYHQVTDSPDKIEAEKEARILRLVFYLGEEVANARERPKWNPESYKKIVEGAAGR